MTEPLLIGLLMLSAMTLYGWSTGRKRRMAQGRWLVARSGVPHALRGVAVHGCRADDRPYARRRAGEPARAVLRDVAIIAAYFDMYARSS